MKKRAYVLYREERRHERDLEGVNAQMRKFMKSTRKWWAQRAKHQTHVYACDSGGLWGITEVKSKIILDEA